MSNQIDIAFVQQFADNLRHLAQQQGSKLLKHVSVKPINGKYAHFERLGAVEASLRLNRHADVSYTDMPHSRRRVEISDYEVADLVDRQDDIRMLIDPRNPYAMSMAWALGRKMDDIILEAAVGNSKSIDASDSSSNVALGSGQTIDEDFGTADSNLTLAKIIEAKRILDKADIIGDDGRVLVHNASALSNLLNDTTVTSADYASIKALVQGEIGSYVGFNFEMMNRLRGTADGTDSDPVQCLALVKSGMGFAMGQDIQVRMDELPSKGYSTQVYGSSTFGATRIEEEKVVKIEVVQSA